MHSAGYFYIIFWFLIVMLIGSESTSSDTKAHSLDSLLQQYAFKELTKPRTKTGIPYDACVPSNLTGINISALILRRYILKWRGYGYYKEPFIPSGVNEEPNVKKLVLVYQNLANCSSLYYPLPGYTYLTPVLGILAYDAQDLYATNVQEFDVQALDDPITIRFPYVQPAPEGSLLKCVYFYSNSLVEFGNVIDGNICLTRTGGHFSIVAEVKVAPSPSPTTDEVAPSPAPTADEVAPSPSPTADDISPRPSPSADENNHQKINYKMWTVVSLGFLIFALVGILFIVVKKFGVVERRQRLDDSATTVEPLLGNTEATLPLEAPTN